jgi:hypothetical protein
VRFFNPSSILSHDETIEVFMVLGEDRANPDLPPAQVQPLVAERGTLQRLLPPVKGERDERILFGIVAMLLILMIGLVFALMGFVD